MVDLADPGLQAAERTVIVDDIETRHVREARAALGARLSDVERLIAAARSALDAEDYDTALIAAEQMQTKARENAITSSGLARVARERKLRLATI